MLPGRSHLLRMWANKVSHADGLVVDRFCNDRDRFGMTLFCHPGRGIQEFGDLTKRVAYHVYPHFDHDLSVSNSRTAW